MNGHCATSPLYNRCSRSRRTVHNCTTTPVTTVNTQDLIKQEGRAAAGNIENVTAHITLPLPRKALFATTIIVRLPRSEIMFAEHSSVSRLHSHYQLAFLLH